MDGFKHVYAIDVRFRDIDALGHVNNATILTYVETARVPFFTALGFRTAHAAISDISFIVAHINCDFRRPIYFGQRVEVGTRVAHVGRSSMRLEHRVEADGQLAAEGHAILVYFDYRANLSLPVSPQMLDRINAFENAHFKLERNGD